LSSGKAQTDAIPRTAEKLSEDDVLAETVILGQRKVRGKEKDGKKE